MFTILYSNKNNNCKGQGILPRRVNAITTKKHKPESPTEWNQTATHEQVGHPAHDRKGDATVDPSMSLPLSDTGVDGVSPAYLVEELLGCRAADTENPKGRK